MAENWQPDVLGPGFRRCTLPLGHDSEGDYAATLVHYQAPTPTEWDEKNRQNQAIAADCDILAIHGWSDYFFNRELAWFWSQLGARFFALDLRKYGRSLRTGQTPGLINDLSDYDEEIQAALDVMSTNQPRRLILMGHSTGGLTISLWAARHPGQAQGIVLNSPWLEFQLSSIGREALMPVISLGAKIRPLAPLPNVDLGFYTRAVHHRYGGEWDYDLTWRPERGFTTTPQWLTAILAGHSTINQGITIEAPVLTLVSSTSTISPQWHESMLHSDSVLVVDDIAHRSLNLGKNVTVVRIDGALHDVTLSQLAARQAAYAAIAQWMAGITYHYEPQRTTPYPSA